MVDPIWLVLLAVGVAVVVLIERRRRTPLTPEEHVEQRVLRAEQDRSLSRGHGYIETDGPPGVGT